MTTKLIVLACLLAATNARSLTNSNFAISKMNSRIIGGHNAKPGEFPHQISLQFKNPEEGIIYFKHFCGGSILNHRWILSAAHCVEWLEDPDPQVIFVVKAGKHDLNSTEGSEQISLIENYFIHEKYEKKSEFGVGPYDIGLIKLKDPLRLNKRVAPISLPEKDSEPTGNVILSGWGAVNNNSWNPEMPAILQTANLEIVDRETCNKAVNELLEEGPVNLVDQTNVCSGPLTGGKASCGGDSGGPLISKDRNGNTTVVGVVSWGANPCRTTGAPSVYARTSFFIDWIENTISNN